MKLILHLTERSRRPCGHLDNEAAVSRWRSFPRPQTGATCTCGSGSSGRVGRWGALVALGVLLATLAAARAQLAITELMSDGAANCTGVVTNHPDFWELTNFSTTNTIDLSGYLFRDAPLPAIAERIADGVVIGPGESILFVRRRITEALTEAMFCEWWGLDPCPNIRFFAGWGFEALGEQLWLWDASTNIVDYVSFGEAKQGVTFTHDTGCGRFGEPSEADVCGAFRAARCSDVGSPGFAFCGPIPLTFLRPPWSQTVELGSAVTFSAPACGLPRPRVQWFFNDAPRTSEATTGAPFPTVVNFAGSSLAWKAVANPMDLAILSASSADIGRYFAVLDNGLERATSAVVTLAFNTNSTPPWIESPPPELRWPFVDGRPQTNLTVVPGQTAELAVLARGYPRPAFQWSWSEDGIHFTALTGKTNSTLVISDAQPADAGIYQVRVENEWGVTNAFAKLTTKPKPRLRITEAMGAAFDSRRPDWWELTNIGDEPVELYGHRWDDSPNEIGAGPTVTNLLTIQPAESVIFIEDRTPDAFLDWWGADNLPPTVKFILYSANGLTELGDAIRIWNPTATNKSDFIDKVEFSTFTPGSSRWFDGSVCAEFGIVSVAGECGAFHAMDGGDVGSPGWTAWTPPRLTSIGREGGVVQLRWKAQPGSTNLVQFTSSFGTPPNTTVWSDLDTFCFDGASGMAFDTTAGNERQRFYRLVKLAPDDCGCRESP